MFKSISFYLSLDYFFLAFNLHTTTNAAEISYTNSVEESDYSSKLEIYLSCNSYINVGGKTLFPAELEDTIQMAHILKGILVQRL